ncbi:RcnB family protein [Pseudomonas sp. WS 5071]|uniref:RcnB family protein n=1 Tax=Pseudomonas sp. WS 5071 TaxID=2717479 RepID=UPI001473A140|nr:RcnB family protein [Pseudomonas sp. WS 5071]NMY76077.1 RcnB family protein [Pseudomonas sp. WS 5071]
MRNIISASLIAGFLCAMPYAAQAADDNASDCKHNAILAKSMDHHTCYTSGDKAPDQYTREESAIKNWKAKSLPQPSENSQWVQFSDHYVLVNRTNSVIEQIRTLKGTVVSQ